MIRFWDKHVKVVKAIMIWGPFRSDNHSTQKIHLWFENPHEYSICCNIKCKKEINLCTMLDGIKFELNALDI